MYDSGYLLGSHTVTPCIFPLGVCALRIKDCGRVVYELGQGYDKYV